jgi:hypothetical protein
LIDHPQNTDIGYLKAVKVPKLCDIT